MKLYIIKKKNENKFFTGRYTSDSCLPYEARIFDNKILAEHYLDNDINEPKNWEVITVKFEMKD